MTITTPTTEVTIELLSVGNELLSGTTINSNGYWISGKITKVGGYVKRITVVGDDVHEISSAVNESLRRRPDWLIISGGLGPTYDDNTLLGVGSALGLELVVDQNAVKMLKNSYERRSSTRNYELNNTRLKMAMIPRGSIPIQNPIGSAPSVLIEVDTTPDQRKTKLVCLPGVPKEMEAIFSETLLPQIKEAIGDYYITESVYRTIGISEAMLAPTLSKIVGSYSPKSIYLKTHPEGYTNNDDKPRLNIQIVSKGKNKAEVQMRYNNILNILSEEIYALGGKIS
jgi:nicotinamide-nucleotide amidase